jgi:hypothetical protein
MGDFKPSSNPQVISPLRVNVVRGLGGKTLEIIRQYSSKGDDVSAQFANDLTDLDVTKIGTMIRRPGFRKTSTTGLNYSIRSIFMVSLGGVKYYGVDYGTLYLYDLLGLEFPEDEPWDDWPPAWPIPPSGAIHGARNDVPMDDPSQPPESQPCKVGVVWSSSPTSLTYSMHRGGPVPTTQRFYMMRRGWALLTSHVTVSDASAWMEVFSNTGWSWINGQCDGIVVIPTNVPVNGKDSSGNWLERGSYAGLISALTNSGDSMQCTVALTVVGPVITLGATTLTYFIKAGDSSTDKTFTVTNSGDTGSTLAWAYSLLSLPTELTGAVTVSPASASLAKGSSSTVTVSIDPAGVTTGTYTFGIRIYDTLYTSDYKDVTVTVKVGLLNPALVYGGGQCRGSLIGGSLPENWVANQYSSMSMSRAGYVWTAQLVPGVDTILTNVGGLGAFTAQHYTYTPANVTILSWTATEFKAQVSLEVNPNWVYPTGTPPPPPRSVSLVFYFTTDAADPLLNGTVWGLPNWW